MMIGTSMQGGEQMGAMLSEEGGIYREHGHTILPVTLSYSKASLHSLLD